jgi:hypothetical protein
MATYSVARSKHATLAAATVDTVNISSDTNYVEVVSRGDDYISFTVDGSAPTVFGDNTFVVLPRGALQVLDAGGPTSQVKVISASAIPYSVQAVG